MPSSAYQWHNKHENSMIHRLSSNSDYELQLATEWAQLVKHGSTIEKSKHTVYVVWEHCKQFSL